MRRSWPNYEEVAQSKYVVHDDKRGPITTCRRPISKEVTEKSYIPITTVMIAHLLRLMYNVYRSPKVPWS